ncbi:hypothetical protein PAPYR_7467 [Paratrimastix pyriformis]|uniref:Uncharacterized protein n=1 Tax=Paratrimastix pyriformis TaxID=342808 RepID=A0ABQ8UD13_9EUKA|nr:hypothetical protein PAPYR_7467 [Paratrimastix pyriformis]
MERLPNEVLGLIFQNLNSGVAIVHGKHLAFLKEVSQARGKLIVKRKAAKRREAGPTLKDLLNGVAWLLLNPLFTWVALPGLLALVVLRAEGAIGWSLHAVLAPADFLFLCGLAFFGFFALTDPSRTAQWVLGLITAIFPVAAGTLHWAAARADWIAASGAMQGGATPGGLNWMYIFAPGMALALALAAMSLCFLSSSGEAFVVGGLGIGAPLVGLAFLGLLGYKLQWGGPGFLYTYAFIPLWVATLGVEAFLVKFVRPSRRPLRFALRTVCVPVALAATVALVAVRLDWGLPHLAYLAIPTALWSARPEAPRGTPKGSPNPGAHPTQGLTQPKGSPNPGAHPTQGLTQPKGSPKGAPRHGGVMAIAVRRGGTGTHMGAAIVSEAHRALAALVGGPGWWPCGCPGWWPWLVAPVGWRWVPLVVLSAKQTARWVGRIRGHIKAGRRAVGLSAGDLAAIESQLSRTYGPHGREAPPRLQLAARGPGAVGTPLDELLVCKEALAQLAALDALENLVEATQTLD